METLQENKKSNSHRLIQNLKVLPQNWEKLEILQHVTIFDRQMLSIWFFWLKFYAGNKDPNSESRPKKGKKETKNVIIREVFSYIH